MKPRIGSVPFGETAFSAGDQNIANEVGAVAFGLSNLADGRYSFVSGRDNKAGYAAHAEGSSNIASGLQAHAEGYGTKATGDRAHAEGASSKAEGLRSHTEGFTTTASGENAHAEGYLTKALGNHSHAEGQGTQSSGARSHSEGIDSKANGTDSHAEGFRTEANGQGSHSEGVGTVTNGNAQHAQGQYNVKDTGLLYTDIVGWGSDADNRANIYALTKTGDLKLKGNVYVGCNDDSTGGTVLCGVPLYQHWIHYSYDSTDFYESFDMKLITSSATPFGMGSLISYMTNKGSFPCYAHYQDDNVPSIVDGFTVSVVAGALHIYGTESNGVDLFQGGATLTRLHLLEDTVTTL